VEITQSLRGFHAGVGPGEDPLHGSSGDRVRVEAMQASAPLGVDPVRVRSGVDESVAIRWSAAETPALVAGLGAHRLGGAPAGA
jgi:hypothetical protein